LTVTIDVAAGAFRGRVNAAIITSELVTFLPELQRLHDTLRGVAEFTTCEGQLSLRLTGDGRGHIELAGELVDAPGTGNRLHFSLQFDQSELRASIRELEQVIETFPVRSA